MTLTLLTRACTIITRVSGAVDSNGDIIKGETSTTAVCDLQPVRGDEAEGGNLGITTYNLYLDGDLDLDADSAVVVDAERYELVGDAAPRRNPRTGATLYTHAVVRRVR